MKDNLTNEERNEKINILIEDIKENDSEKSKAELYNMCLHYWRAWCHTNFDYGRRNNYEKYMMKDFEQDLYFQVMEAVRTYKKDKGSFMGFMNYRFREIICSEKSKYSIVHIPYHLHYDYINTSEEINEDIFSEASTINMAEKSFHKEDLQFIIKQKLNILKPIEKIVIELRYEIIYIKNNTLINISKFLFENGYTKNQLSIERIRQIVKSANKKLGIKKNIRYKKCENDLEKRLKNLREYSKKYRKKNEFKLKEYQKEYQKEYRKKRKTKSKGK